MSIFSVLESETKTFKYWHLSELRTSKLHNFIDQVSIIKGLYYCVFTVYCALCNALMSHVRSESSNNKLGRCLFYKCGEGSEKKEVPSTSLFSLKFKFLTLIVIPLLPLLLAASYTVLISERERDLNHLSFPSSFYFLPHSFSNSFHFFLILTLCYSSPSQYFYSLVHLHFTLTINMFY